MSEDEIDSGMGAGVALGTHVCAFYRGSVERDRILRSFLGKGNADGDNLMVVRHELQPDQLGVLLADGSGRAPKNAMVATTRNQYLPDGRFDPEGTLDRWTGLFQDVSEVNDKPLRAVAEMTWAVGESITDPTVEDRLRDYEDRLGETLSPYKVAGICMYDLDQFDARIVPDLLRVHETLVVRDVIVRSSWSPADAGADDLERGTQALLSLSLLIRGCRRLEDVRVLVIEPLRDVLCYDFAALLHPEGSGWHVFSGSAGPVGDEIAGRLRRAAAAALCGPMRLDWAVPGYAETVTVRLPGRSRDSFLVLAWREEGERPAYQLEFAVLASHLGPLLADLVEPLVTHDGDGTRSLVDTSWAAIEELLDPREQPVSHAGGTASWDIPQRVVATQLPRRLSPAERLCLVTGEGGFPSTLRDGLVISLVPFETDVEAERTRMESELGGERVFVGVSEEKSSPAVVTKAVDEARTALRIGLERGVRTSYYSNLGLLRLLRADNTRDAIRDLINGWLGDLLDYDRNRNIDLVPTLRAFFDTGGNQAATAEVLGIHISTLKYRLKRVEEVSGLSLEQPEVRFNLQFAIEAMRSIDFADGAP